MAENVEWNNTHSLVEVLGSIAFDTKGSVQDQLTQLFNQKLDSTDLSNYVNSTLKSEVIGWLNQNVNPVGSAVVVDSSLTISGAAADAKKTGDEISDLKSVISDANEGYRLSLNSSMFTKGIWSNRSISSTNNRICVNTLIPVKRGDVLLIKSGSTLMYAHGIYEEGATTTTDYKTWATISSDYYYTIPVDGNLFVQCKKSDEASLTPSEFDGEVYVLSNIGVALRNLLNDYAPKTAACYNEIFYTHEISFEWVEGLMVNGRNFTTKASDKCTKPFTLYKDETVSIKTKGDGSYLFNAITKVDSLDVTIAAGYRAGTALKVITNNKLTEYTYTAVEDEEYIILSALNDPTTVVTFSNLKVFSKIDDIESDINTIHTYCNGILKNKAVMFFGDSLTAASTSGIVGFARRIADAYGMQYKAFVHDSADSNPDDVPVDFPRFTNYAKDGTCNRVTTGKTDSVVERVKRHITSDTLIDYVLIECCVNDMAQANRNKGAISDSYTAVFDTTTTIGAIEETLRYLTTLMKPIRVGGFIPWYISWQTSGWFDDYIAVFEKWGVPLFDMRKTAGFNMKSCAAHRLQYSLSSDSYPNYDSTTTYNLDDKMKFGGILYKCLANGVTGIPPTNTTYWMEVSSESADGTHLNNNGHIVVTGKIQKFLESI